MLYQVKIKSNFQQNFHIKGEKILLYDITYPIYTHSIHCYRWHLKVVLQPPPGQLMFLNPCQNLHFMDLRIEAFSLLLLRMILACPGRS